MRQGRDFVILEAAERVAASWHGRWDSLRLFTPACFKGLPGMDFPAASDYYPTKEEMAGYLHDYVNRLGLPVETGAHVEQLTRHGRRYRVTTNTGVVEADHVIVATGANNVPRMLPFADEDAADVFQCHSSRYRNPSQLAEGPVLVVGAGNSGCEIAVEVAATRPVWLAGRDVGHVPVTLGCRAYRLVRRLNVDTRLGRWVAAKRSTGGDLVVRVRPRDLAAAGVDRVPRVAGIRNGQPLLEDGRSLDADNIIWCTGFVRELSWIELPVFDTTGELLHQRGVVPTEPGLHFVGLPLQSTVASDLVGGVGDDAQYVTAQIARRAM